MHTTRKVGPNRERPGAFLAFLFASLLCAAGLSAQGAAPSSANLLLTHGHIYTSDPAHPWAEACAITGEKIVAVGADKDLAAYRGPNTTVMDLGGRMAMPGIIDTHFHLLIGSLSYQQIDVSSAHSISEIQDTVRAFAKAHPDQKMLLGRGWFYGEMFGASTLPTKEILDAVVSDRPIVLHSFDEHSLWLNSRALAVAGVTRTTPDPNSSDPVAKGVVRDPKTGEPTGVLKESGQQIAQKAFPEPTREEKLEAIRFVLKDLNKNGITSVINATGSIPEMELYAELHRRGQLTVRTQTSFAEIGEKHVINEQALKSFDEARDRFKDDWVRAGLIKFFMDGVVETHSAAMLGGYADDPKFNVPPNYLPEEFKNIVLTLDKHHLQIMTHAIGEYAVRNTLDAYEAAGKINGPRDRRFRIEHIETISPADIPRFGQLHVIASMQPLHCCPDPAHIAPWEINAGPARFPYGFAWQQIRSYGGVIIHGSDWPVVTFNPFLGLQNAVIRETEGRPLGGWYPRQTETLDQALAGYTRDAAYAEFTDDRKGSVAAGKLADIIVLSQNLFAIPPREIGKTRVLLTIVGGEIVHRDGL